MFIRVHPWFPRILATFTLTLTFTFGAAEPSEAPSTYLESIERLDPMDTIGLDRGLATVLRNYYQKNFTGEENWQQVQSIRFDGTLHLPQGVLRFTAFKKKPDYCKVVIFAGHSGRIVMAYDGTDAWQLNTLQKRPATSPEKTPLLDEEGWLGEAETGWFPQPEAMPEPDALNFIRDATAGGHLLYPKIEGKKVELLGTTTAGGERLYDLQTTLPDGQQIRSQLDMTTFAEVRQITINNLNGDEELTTHSDFHEIDGVRIPFTSTLTIDGQQIHQSRIQRVQTNLGVMPWMFSRPSGAHIPGEAPESPPVASVPETGEGGRPRQLTSKSAPGTRISASAPSELASQNQPLSLLAQPSQPSDMWSTKSAFELESPTSVFNIAPDTLTKEETAGILQELEADTP